MAAPAIPTARPATTPTGSAIPRVMLASAPSVTTNRPSIRSGLDRCGEAATMIAAAMARRMAGYTAGGSEDARLRSPSDQAEPAAPPAAIAIR